MAVALRSGGEGRVGAQVRGESLEPQEPKGTTSTQHTRSASEQAQVTGWLGPWRTCCQQEWLWPLWSSHFSSRPAVLQHCQWTSSSMQCNNKVVAFAVAASEKHWQLKLGPSQRLLQDRTTDTS